MWGEGQRSRTPKRLRIGDWKICRGVGDLEGRSPLLLPRAPHLLFCPGLLVKPAERKRDLTPVRTGRLRLLPFPHPGSPSALLA